MQQNAIIKVYRVIVAFLLQPYRKQAHNRMRRRMESRLIGW